MRFIERNPGNLDIAQLETFFNVNPILLKTKRILDQQGPKGLLLDNVGIDRQLALRINLEKAVDEEEELENMENKGKDK